MKSYNYKELGDEANAYRGALLLEQIISGNTLRRCEKFARIITSSFLVLWLFPLILLRVPLFISLMPDILLSAPGFSNILSALFSLSAGLWIIFVLLYAFFCSYYFKDMELALPEPWIPKNPAIRYEVAEIAHQGLDDPLLDFLASRFGRAVLLRLGITKNELHSFLKERKQNLPSDITLTSSEDSIGLFELAQALCRNDEGFRRLLASKGQDERDFTGASAWVSRIESRSKLFRRFWGRDQLGRIRGIGKDWAYGETALLERYAADITLHPSFNAPLGVFGKAEAEATERILSRGRETNVLLVADEGVPAINVLIRLSRHIVAGTILPSLEHKRIFVFDGALFVSAMKEKVAFEQELGKLLKEAARAGNIIFCLDHFDSFFEGAQKIQSDILTLLDPFLTAPTIQIIALAETGAFHRFLESNPRIAERFERVLVAGVSGNSVLPILEDEALLVEIREGVFFTFEAIRTVAESAERYFQGGVLQDTAVDLLLELAPKAKLAGRRVIGRDDVLELVSGKTGIATGEVRGEERTKLLKLEEILHERVVGQDDAIRAISGALRRARTGVGNPNRPIGSFLFLGPTGVGKTETSKALAQVFFGNEQAIMRFDMSEFQTGDALERLIGNFGGKPGVLASRLRDRPYGVILLDEFEKTSKDVHDLFLQILDEGFFADAVGKKVNVRSSLIIATSNAGSDIIWKVIQEGKGLNRDAVITDIISHGIFKPELLNRFDGIILFHPLKTEELRIIARRELEKLARRLTEKGLELVISDVLLDYLISVGQDPKFGARPMNRAIAEKVEQRIAEKILRGELLAGSRVELTSADFT